MKNKYSHNTLGECAVIQTQPQDGLCPAFIAASLGRRRSAIARELARNGGEQGRMPVPLDLRHIVISTFFLGCQIIDHHKFKFPKVDEFALVLSILNTIVKLYGVPTP